MKQQDKKLWSCKIGEVDRADLPQGADGPMRVAVSAAYRALTGKEAAFIFSGWDAELTEHERAVVERPRVNADLDLILREVAKAAKHYVDTVEHGRVEADVAAYRLLVWSLERLTEDY